MNFETINSNIVTGLAALMGSLVGALASLASTWFTLRYQGRRDNLARRMNRCECLYSDFVGEAARMYSDALVQTLCAPQAMATLWGLLARIRLTGSQTVLEAAEKITKAIGEQYRAPNLSADQIRERFLTSGDPLNEFSLACRAELEEMYLLR